jgi:arsenate reductase (thioredoxin)
VHAQSPSSGEDRPVQRRAWAQSSTLNLTRSSGEPAERPLVLFVCVHNAGRSRMAEAFFNHLAGDRYRAISAGTMPAERPHPEVVEAMTAVDIAMDDAPGTLLTPAMAEHAVRVVSMGCNVEEACPELRMDVEDWALDDPKGRSPEQVAAIRDRIEARVRNLVADLDRAHSPLG